MTARRGFTLKAAAPVRARTLAELIDREYRRIQRLTRERNSVAGRLQRARVRLSVLKRMANDEARGRAAAPVTDQ